MLSSYKSLAHKISKNILYINLRDRYLRTRTVFKNYRNEKTKQYNIHNMILSRFLTWKLSIDNSWASLKASLVHLKKFMYNILLRSSMCKGFLYIYNGI